jgi:Fascin domain
MADAGQDPGVRRTAFLLADAAFAVFEEVANEGEFVPGKPSWRRSGRRLRLNVDADNWTVRREDPQEVTVLSDGDGDGDDGEHVLRFDDNFDAFSCVSHGYGDVPSSTQTRGVNSLRSECALAHGRRELIRARMTLRSKFNRRFLSTQPSGVIEANRAAAGAWEEFVVELRSPSRLSLRSCHDGSFVSVTPAGSIQSGALFWPRSCEVFAAEFAPGEFPARTLESLTTFHGMIFAVQDSGELVLAAHDMRLEQEQTGFDLEVAPSEVRLYAKACGQYVWMHDGRNASSEIFLQENQSLGSSDTAWGPSEWFISADNPRDILCRHSGDVGLHEMRFADEAYESFSCLHGGHRGQRQLSTPGEGAANARSNVNARETRLALRSYHENHVSAAPNGAVTCYETHTRGWEIFRVVDAGDGQVSLRSHHFKYLSAQPDGTIVCDRDEPRAWELFRIIPQDRGSITLLTHHGTFLSAQPQGTLTANRTEAQTYEQFAALWLGFT